MQQQRVDVWPAWHEHIKWVWGSQTSAAPKFESLVPCNLDIGYYTSLFTTTTNNVRYLFNYVKCHIGLYRFWKILLEKVGITRPAFKYEMSSGIFLGAFSVLSPHVFNYDIQRAAAVKLSLFMFSV